MVSKDDGLDTKTGAIPLRKSRRDQGLLVFLALLRDGFTDMKKTMGRERRKSLFCSH